MQLNFDNAKILITGGSGSWGNELSKQLLEKFSPKQIIIYSRGELAQVNMQRKFKNNPILKFVIGDIRDIERLKEITKGVDYIFHLAALKHVPICEDHPGESIKTNILGAENIIKAATHNNIKYVVDISTDKACNPINVYGMCKTIGERMMINANHLPIDTRFVCIRAGNVMGTNGSIIPFFKQICEDSEAPVIPITDPHMTRYFMTLQEAIGLVFKALLNPYGGEVFVTKMPACKITDIAHVIGKYYGKNYSLKTIGVRPGEKIHEELISQYESPRAVEDKNFRIILPEDKSLDEKYIKYPEMKEEKYTSNDYLMNQEEILDMLVDGKFLKK